MKKIFLLKISLFLFLGLSAQTVSKSIVICDTLNFMFKSAPFFQYYDKRKIFDEELKFLQLHQSGKSFKMEFMNEMPFLAVLVNKEVLILPKKTTKIKIVGDGQSATFYDSNDVNNIINEINNFAVIYRNKLLKNTKYNEFTKLITSYYSKTKVFLDSVCRTNKDILADPNIKSAIRQIAYTNIGFFSVYPLIFDMGYNKDSLLKIISNTSQVVNSTYLLQSQDGRLFIKQLFLNLALPMNNYYLNQTLDRLPFFKDIELRKYLSFIYFNNCLSGEISNHLTKVKLLEQFDKFSKQPIFNSDEKIYLDFLKSKISNYRTDIKVLFSTQNLYDLRNEKIPNTLKKEILNIKGKIILEYWASWCYPCLNLIARIPSSHIKYNGDIYTFIFVSKDNNHLKWKEKKYPCLVLSNSFRLIKSPKDDFNKYFQIKSIPRTFLIEDGTILDDNFSREKLHEIINKGIFL